MQDVSRHGHEVMRMMLEADRAFTPEELIAEIESRFGADCRFHTCSAEDLDARGLVQFLNERGKFVPEGNALRTKPENICDHE